MTTGVLFYPIDPMVLFAMLRIDFQMDCELQNIFLKAPYPHLSFVLKINSHYNESWHYAILPFFFLLSFSPVWEKQKQDMITMVHLVITSIKEFLNQLFYSGQE